MKNSRLLRILNTFSKKEIRDLKKWLLSPAHNQREDVRELFEYLIKHLDNSSEKALEKERIFKKLFSSEKYDDARFRQTIHFLMKAIEDFLTYQELSADKVSAMTSLARVYRKRKLDKAFKKTIKAAKDLQVGSDFRNVQFQQNEFRIHLEEYAFKESQKRTAEMNLQELADSLDVTFISNKLKYSYLMHAHRAVYQTNYDFGLLNTLLDYIEQSELTEIPAIGVYYYGLKANLEKNEPAYFQKFKTELLKNAHLFPQSEARDIWLMAINYLINKMNSGGESTYRELFEIYKSGLENKVLIEKNSLSRFTFRNIVVIGLKISEFEWVSSFIEQYQEFLNESHRENIVHFSKGNLAYAKKDYTTAMRLYTQVEYKDTLMNLNAKNMLVKMLYEEEEFDTLESLLNSMRTYLTRKKVVGYHKAFITNFIKLTKKLLKVQPYDKEQVERLRSEINEAKPMNPTEREWLLTRLKNI